MWRKSICIKKLCRNNQNHDEKGKGKTLGAFFEYLDPDIPKSAQMHCLVTWTNRVLLFSEFPI
jgi:hypothetical protein